MANKKRKASAKTTPKGKHPKQSTNDVEPMSAAAAASMELAPPLTNNASDVVPKTPAKTPQATQAATISVPEVAIKAAAMPLTEEAKKAAQFAAASLKNASPPETGGDGKGVSIKLEGDPPKVSLVNATITPINNLVGVGVIKGVICAKSARRRWTSKNGYNGFLFSANLYDGHGYVKLVFSDKSEQTWFTRIERGRQFIFEIVSNGLLRAAKTDFNKTGHKFEIRATADMPYCRFDDPTIPLLSTSPNLKALATLPGGEEQATDLHLIVVQVKEPQSVIRRDNSGMVDTRELQCIDDSVSIEPSSMLKVAVWGEDARKPFKTGDVITLDLAALHREKQGIRITHVSNEHDTKVTINKADSVRAKALKAYAEALFPADAN